jgi:hypothetical protein
MKAVTLLVFLLAPTNLPREKKPDPIDEALARCYKILKYGKENEFYEPDKRDAAITLGLLGDERAVPLLLEHLSNEENQHLRFEIIQALARIKSTKGVPGLEKALKDSYNLNREIAARALKEITGKDYKFERLPDPPGVKRVERLLASTPAAAPEQRPSGPGSFLEKGKTYRFNGQRSGTIVGRVLAAPSDGWVKVEIRQGAKKSETWVNLRALETIEPEAKAGK